MSDISKKIISLIGLLATAIVGVILRKVFQVWGIFDPFSEWLGGWLKMHIAQAQVEWTIAGALALLGYAALLWIVWRYHHIPPIANAPLATDISQSRRNMNVSTIEIQQPESSPQQIGSSPLKIEFGGGDKYERTEQILETGIFRRLIYVSVFNESVDDISDCNIRIIAATPRPDTGDNPTTFPVPFGANFDLRGKQRKFIQIARFAENPGNGSILERDNIIISAASGGLFAGWTTIPIPPEDSPAILTLEAFAPCIASRTAHLHIRVTQRRIHAQII